MFGNVTQYGQRRARERGDQNIVASWNFRLFFIRFYVKIQMGSGYNETLQLLLRECM